MERDVRQRYRSREQVKEVARGRVGEGFGKCPCCGALTVAEFEWCPECGAKLVDYCIFCGAPMSREDVDCPECGMPADGVVCPDCRILNHRAFCRKCGKPLNIASKKAVQRAKEDVKVQQAARLLVQISELRAELESEQDGQAPDSVGPTEGELRLQELMSKVGFTVARKPEAQTSQNKRRSREEVMEQYRKAVEEANRLFEEMVPPAGSTPQEQRNYYTARKVAVTEVIEENWYGVVVNTGMFWECNRCHVLHNNPSECGVREFGGNWIQGSYTEVVPEGTPGAQKFTEKIGERIVYKREE